MNLELRKRKNPNLKKLVKTTKEGTIIEESPVYVLMEEVEGNVLQEGSAITPEVIEKLNWKDSTGIEFIPTTLDVLPVAKEGVVQIVSKANGEIWCIPALGIANPFPLGNSDFENLVKKYETNYIQGRTFEFFVLDKEAKLFAKRMRVGAIPVREVENNEFQTDGTYIDMNHTGNIVMFVKGIKKYEFSEEKLLLNNHDSTIGINSYGCIKLDATAANESVKIYGNSFSISAPKTKVEEADVENGEATKFNCHTDLYKASYGNKTFRLQFNNSSIRLLDMNRNKRIFEIEQSGSISVLDTYIPLDHPYGFASRDSNQVLGKISTIGTYVTNWKTATGGNIQFRESNGNLYVGIDGEFYQNDGQYKVIDESTINSYIDSYINANLEEKIKSCIRKCYKKVNLYTGNVINLELGLNENTWYQIDFSQSPNGGIHSFITSGADVKANRAIFKVSNIYYKIVECEAAEEEYDDYLNLCECDEYGNLSRNYAYFRAIYSLE